MVGEDHAVAPCLDSENGILRAPDTLDDERAVGRALLDPLEVFPAQVWIDEREPADERE